MSSLIINLLIGWVLSYLILAGMGVSILSFILAVLACIVWNLTIGKLIKNLIEHV